MKSKKIVIATIGSLGDLHPAIALALELQARGHQITLATSAVYQKKIEQTGINFRSLRPDLPKSPEVAKKIMHPTKGLEFFLRKIFLPALPETYTDLMNAVEGCNLLITNELIFPASAISEKIGIAWISYTLQPASFFSIYDPLLIAVPYLAKSRFLGVWAVKLFKQLAKFMTRSWAEPIRQLRKELELPNVNVSSPLFEEKFSPDLVLAMFSSVFAKPQPDWVKQAKITGFTFYDRLYPNSGLSTELREFLSAGEAPVVFTLGSAAVNTAGNFYTESAIAVEKLGCRAVFLVGNTKLENLPYNAIAVDYAPYSELFPYAKVVIHQGGIGTTAQALRTGVPMLVVPFSYDQPDNAVRVVSLGVGRTISRKKYHHELAIQELQILLNNSQYKTKSTEIAQIIRAENGTKTACDEIETFLVNAKLHK